MSDLKRKNAGSLRVVKSSSCRVKGPWPRFGVLIYHFFRLSEVLIYWCYNLFINPITLIIHLVHFVNCTPNCDDKIYIATEPVVPIAVV